MTSNDQIINEADVPSYESIEELRSRHRKGQVPLTRQLRVDDVTYTIHKSTRYSMMEMVRVFPPVDANGNALKNRLGMVSYTAAGGMRTGPESREEDTFPPGLNKWLVFAWQFNDRNVMMPLNVRSTSPSRGGTLALEAEEKKAAPAEPKDPMPEVKKQLDAWHDKEKGEREKAVKDIIDALSKHKDEMTAHKDEMNSMKSDHAAAIKDLERGHQEVRDQLTRDHEYAVYKSRREQTAKDADFKRAKEEEQEVMVKKHQEEVDKLKSSQNEGKIGHVANVKLINFHGKPIIDSKVDTGSDICSLHATDIQWNGGGSVSFRSPELFDGTIRMPAMTSTVKTADKESDYRPVVKLDLLINGKVLSDVEVNLNDRSAMTHKFLIGKNALAKGGFIIDVTHVGETEEVDWDYLESLFEKDLNDPKLEEATDIISLIYTTLMEND